MSRKPSEVRRIAGLTRCADALERIAEALERYAGPRHAMLEDLVAIGMPRGYAMSMVAQDFFAEREKAKQSATVEQAESRLVCSMCNHGEHARCLRPEPKGFSSSFDQCECPICHQEPGPNVSTTEDYTGPFAKPGDKVAKLAKWERHPFEGMIDNHFCTKCGAGRLHGIHQ